MYDNVIFLVAQRKYVDEYGDTNTVNTERRVFAELKSITQSESIRHRQQA